MPGPSVRSQVVGVGEGVGVGVGVGLGSAAPRRLTRPATTVACPSTPPLTRDDSVVTRYVLIGRSTKPSHPVPSVVVVRMTIPVLASTRCTTVPVSGVPSVATAVPRRWPKIGCVFQVIAGTAGALANTGGATLSYCDGCVNALLSSARPIAPLRVPASVIASGVRYE